MDPLTGKTLNDMLCYRAIGNSGCTFAQRCRDTLGSSYNNYVVAYGAGGQFYKNPDPLPGAGFPPVMTGSFAYNWPVAVGIGGMSDADFKANIPELTTQVQGWPQFPA